MLYLDFELSEKQFQLRYTDEYGKLPVTLAGLAAVGGGHGLAEFLIGQGYGILAGGFQPSVQFVTVKAIRGGTVLPLCGFQRGEIHPCRADSRLYRPD